MIQHVIYDYSTYKDRIDNNRDNIYIKNIQFEGIRKGYILDNVSAYYMTFTVYDGSKLYTLYYILSHEEKDILNEYVFLDNNFKLIGDNNTYYRCGEFIRSNGEFLDIYKYYQYFFTASDNNDNNDDIIDKFYFTESQMYTINYVINTITEGFSIFGRCVNTSFIDSIPYTTKMIDNATLENDLIIDAIYFDCNKKPSNYFVFFTLKDNHFRLRITLNNKYLTKKFIDNWNNNDNTFKIFRSDKEYHKCIEYLGEDYTKSCTILDTYNIFWFKYKFLFNPECGSPHSLLAFIGKQNDNVVIVSIYESICTGIVDFLSKYISEL